MDKSYPLILPIASFNHDKGTRSKLGSKILLLDEEA